MLLKVIDADNEALKRFEHVIRNSEYKRITLKPHDILILDNERMLLKHIADNEFEGLIKKIVLN